MGFPLILFSLINMLNNEHETFFLLVYYNEMISESSISIDLHTIQIREQHFAEKMLISNIIIRITLN